MSAVAMVRLPQILQPPHPFTTNKQEQMAYWGENSKTLQVDIYTLAASLNFLVTEEIPTECCGRKYNNSELIESKIG